MSNPLTTLMCSLKTNGLDQNCGPINIGTSTGQTKPFGMPQGSTCAPDDYDKGTSCNVEWTHLSTLFGGSDVADITVSVQKCSTGSVPRIAASVSGLAQSLVEKPQPCTSDAGCALPFKCVDIKAGLTNMFNLDAVASNPLNNVLWGAYDFPRGIAPGTSPTDWFSFLRS